MSTPDNFSLGSSNIRYFTFQGNDALITILNGDSYSSSPSVVNYTEMVFKNILKSESFIYYIAYEDLDDVSSIINYEKIPHLFELHEDELGFKVELTSRAFSVLSGELFTLLSRLENSLGRSLTADEFLTVMRSDVLYNLDYIDGLNNSHKSKIRIGVLPELNPSMVKCIYKDFH